MAVPQLNQLPYVVDTPDGINGQITGLYQARYINVSIAAGSGEQNVGACLSFSTRETMAFSQRAYLGTDALEPIIGQREITGTLTRDVPRGLSFKRLVQRCYAPGLDGGDVRLDVLPVTIIVRYALVGPNLNYKNPIEDMRKTYYSMYFHEVDVDHSVANPIRETLQFTGQCEKIEDMGITIQTSTPTSRTFARINR